MPRTFAIVADAHAGLVGPQPDGRSYGDACAMIDRACCLHLRDSGYESIILLGDIVNRGYPDEYLRARELLTDCAHRLVPVLGNHELQRGAISNFEAAWRVPAYRLASIAGIDAIILNSGIENLPDTEWHGRIDEAQLCWLDELLPSLSGTPILVFCHHPICGTVRDSEGMLCLENSEVLQSRLTAHRGSIVFFSGHTHTASIVRRGAITCVGAPSLAFWPHSFLRIEVDGQTMRISTICCCDDIAASPDARAHDLEYRLERCGGDEDRQATIDLLATAPAAD